PRAVSCPPITTEQTVAPVLVAVVVVLSSVDTESLLLVMMISCVCELVPCFRKPFSSAALKLSVVGSVPMDEHSSSLLPSELHRCGGCFCAEATLRPQSNDWQRSSSN